MSDEDFKDFEDYAEEVADEEFDMFIDGRVCDICGGSGAVETDGTADLEIECPCCDGSGEV